MAAFCGRPRIFKLFNWLDKREEPENKNRPVSGTKAIERANSSKNTRIETAIGSGDKMKMQDPGSANHTIEP